MAILKMSSKDKIFKLYGEKKDEPLFENADDQELGDEDLLYTRNHNVSLPHELVRVACPATAFTKTGT